VYLRLHQHRSLVVRHVALVVLLFSALGAGAQQFTWNSFTSLINVRAVVTDASGRAWCATTGGAFRVEPVTGAVQVFRNVGALSTINLSSIASDIRTGYTAFGGASGELDVRAPDGTWRHSLDIKLNEQRRTINNLSFIGSLLYIAADYGVSTFDPERFAFISTARHLGAIPPETRAFCATSYGSLLLVGTEGGLAYTALSTPNLADSAFWSVVQKSQLPGSSVLSLAATATYAYVGTSGGLRAWDGASVLPVSGPAGSATTPVIALASLGSVVYAATADELFRIDGLTSTSVQLVHRSPITSVAIGATGDVLVGTNADGLMQLSGDTVRTFSVNSPAGNGFTDLAVDPSGALWAATAFRGGTGSGIARFDGDRWTNFTVGSQPALPTNDIVAIAVDSTGGVWGGTFGAGAVRLRSSGSSYEIIHYDTSNSPFSGIAGAPAYIVVNGIVADRNNIVWMVAYRNESGSVRPHLVAYDVASAQFYPFTNNAQEFRRFYGAAIDLGGTKWMAPIQSFRLNVENPVGLMYFNQGFSLASASDDVWGTVGTPEGLRTNFATAVAVDNEGELWVGTTSGINIIGNPESVVQSSSPLRIRKPFLSILNGDNMNVTAMLVDPLNNKWIGTAASGVFVVNADGSSLLAHFDAATTPLLDDMVTAITMDRRTGIVYLGTKNGLSSVTSPGLRASVLSTLKIGPQPFLVPTSGHLVIYGIGADAEVKIFTAAGAVVREYPAGTLTDAANGAGWDGRDASGNAVATGVYVIVAGLPDGSSQVAKCAVINK
jgi:ligand-binding sensor domain-containing protein